MGTKANGMRMVTYCIQCTYANTEYMWGVLTIAVVVLHDEYLMLAVVKTKQIINVPP